MPRVRTNHVVVKSLVNVYFAVLVTLHFVLEKNFETNEIGYTRKAEINEKGRLKKTLILTAKHKTCAHF